MAIKLFRTIKTQVLYSKILISKKSRIATILITKARSLFPMGPSYLRSWEMIFPISPENSLRTVNTRNKATK